MGPEIDIAKVGQGQLHRVRDLAHAIWPECFAGIIAAELIPGMLAEIYAPETLEADLVERGHVYWLVTVDGVDAGYGSAYRSGGRLWIKKLYLLARYRKLGLGKRLLATALAEFHGATSMGLYVNDGNAPAIAWYEAQGFAVEERVPVQMGPYRFTDFVMAKPL